jgi:hypothetical protein
MTILVRDEEDILDSNIKYHLDQGVDHVIVTDNRSVDGTPDIIDTYVRMGVATYVHEADDNHSQSKWVTRMAKMAHERFQKGWVIHCDADEFWVPERASDLKQYFSKRLLSNVVAGRRHDFICLEGLDAPFWQRMVWRKTVSLNSNGGALPSKVGHRLHADAAVGNGNHKVTGIGRQRLHDKGLDILHFPLRSRAQYERKINTGGKALANNTELPEHIGSTWRHQYRELQETGRLAYVEENVVDVQALEVLKAAKEVVFDPRLRDYFVKKGS